MGREGDNWRQMRVVGKEGARERVRWERAGGIKSEEERQFPYTKMRGL